MVKKLYKQGLEKYSKSSIALGNFLMILWIALGTIACWFFSPAIAWIYFGFAILMVYFILRKLLCTNCYYYNKWCCLGWGKLSVLFFKKGHIKQFNKNIGQKLAQFTYGVLIIIPIVLIIISILDEFSIIKLEALILLLLISFYSGAINRKKACARCKMKLICKGCAVK